MKRWAKYVAGMEGNVWRHWESTRKRCSKCDEDDGKDIMSMAVGGSGQVGMLTLGLAVSVR